MPYIAKTKVDNTTYPIGSTLYGTCSTTANTVNKTVTLSDFDTLMTGVTLHVKFTYSNTASNPKLIVGSEGQAKPIYRYGTTVPGTTTATSWPAGAIVSFTYTGDAWIMNDWNNTDTWTAMTGATSAANGSGGYINATPPKDGYNTKFWRADGTWAIPADNNTDTYVGSAAFADDSTSNAASPVKMTLTYAGSNAGEQKTANIPKVSSSSAGVAPKGAAVSTQTQSTKFLREDGTWAAPSYTINTNTDTLVKQENSTANSTLRVLLSHDANNTTTTNSSYKSGNLTFNPSSGTLTATNLRGALTSSQVTTALGFTPYTKTEVNNLIASVFHYKGTKATVGDLPSSSNATGDVWHVTADSSEYVWNGSAWEELGTVVDLSGYAQLSGANFTGPVNFGDSVSADDLTAGQLMVTGNASFTNNINANTINGVEVGSNPKFTDTITTVSVSGSGNAVTAASASNGAVTLTKGTTFKTAQTAITKPTAATNQWVSAIGQNANGVIEVDYSTLDTSGTWSGKATTAGTADVASKISNITSTDTASSSTTWRQVWMSYADGVTGRPAVTSGLTFQTSTNTLKATKFEGALVGNADTATKWASAQTAYVTLGTASTTTTLQGGSSTAQTLGVDGTLGVGNGGTGATTFTSGQLLIGNGTSAVGTRAITNNTSNTAVGTGTNIPTMNTIYYGLAQINGNSQNRGVSVYAPTAVGSNNQYLKSTGSGAPSWQTPADSSSASAISSSGTNLTTERDIYYGLPTINNSHSYTSSTTIYAPTAGGTSGYYLKGAGTTTAPTWQAPSDSSSASAISTGTALATERDIYYGLPTINGAHNYTSNTTIYAPTAVGTSGQILSSSGSGAPTWVDSSTVGSKIQIVRW